MVTVISSSGDEVIAAVLDDLTEPAFVVTRSSTVISAVVTAASERPPPRLQLLASTAGLKPAVRDFLVGSRAADLIDDGVLALRRADAPPDSQLVVTETAVIPLVRAGDTMGAILAEDPDSVTGVHAAVADAWERAEEVSLRTPPLSLVRNELRETFGSTVVTDFDAMLASRDAIGSGDGLGIVDLCLLLTAKHEGLFYDICKWGEDTRVASKGTFSRFKAGLEERGLITTEKVPVDIGRPRLRLHLGDRLRGLSAVELVDAADDAIE